jgi:hypothetical protein
MNNLRKFIATIIQECLNEREDLNKIIDYNSIVDNLIDKHKKNLKYVLNLKYDYTLNRELHQLIFSISNDNPRFNVVFSGMDSKYGGEVTNSNNIETIIVYNKEYFEQLNSFYWSVIDNKYKRKYFNGIADLTHNDKIKSTILHELVHIHDRIKYNDTEKINKKFTKLVNKNLHNFDDINHNIYSNRTTEYNAYFLQRVDSYLKKNGDFNDFNHFKEYMVDIPIYKSMNDKLKKKYLNRVYSYYQNSQM